MGIVIVIHITVCAGLIFFILIQAGKGGGLIESFSSAESIFGTKTNTFLTKTTTVLAITFFITCLVLAFFSVQQTKSIVERKVKKQLKDQGVVKTTQEISQTKPQQQTKTTGTVEETNAAKETAATNKQ